VGWLQSMTFAPSVWVHFFVVEMRGILLFYFTVVCLIKAPTIRLHLALRRGHWCAVPACNLSGESQYSCVADGVGKAMWSFDLNFEDPSLCTKFHGTNLGGVLHFSAIGLLVVIVMFVFLQLWRLDAESYSSGSYIAFSVTFLRRNTFFQTLSWICMGYVLLLSAIGPFNLLFVLPSEVIEAVDQGRWPLVVSFLKNDASTYLVACLTAFTLARGTGSIFSFDSELCSVTQFKRTWQDLFIQTNGSFMRELERALVKAKYGETEALADLMQDPSSVSEFLESCDPNVEGGEKCARGLPAEHRRLLASVTDSPAGLGR